MTHSQPPSGRTLLGLVLAAITCIALAVPANAQGDDGALAGFVPSSDYLLEVDGTDDMNGEVFYSRGAGAFLVLSSKLPSPVLLWPRTRKVDTIHVMKVAKQPDGSVNLLPEPVLESFSSFEVVGDRVQFTADGVTGILKTKPFLLGDQDLAAMSAYSAEYRHTAEAYEPSGPILEQLRAESDDILVKVYFGSWCPACKQMVPRIMKVAGELEGSKIRVEFYGLPSPFDKEPQAQKDDVHGVPTGIVYKDGREVGRISGNLWKIPELALKDILL